MVRFANPLRYRKRVNGSILPKVQARRISIPTIGLLVVSMRLPPRPGAGNNPGWILMGFPVLAD
jgi:hypothetical protein